MTSGSLPAAAERRRSRTDRAEPGRGAIPRAIVQAVAYADVFDFPMTADEIHRYLISVLASRGDVRNLLSTHPPDELNRTGRYFTLVGRESAIETRRVRATTSADYWRRALHYGQRISNLPFVRMVAVTGGLAMDNMTDDDIDYMIVTEPGRLWLCRAMIVGVVRLAALSGTELCPNYLVSENALTLSEHNLFTAHELAQMVPISGVTTYQRLRDVNRWTDGYLPNAAGAPRRVIPIEPARRKTRRIVERTLSSRICTPIERWEMSRKIHKFSSHGNRHVEAAFGPDWCKGHFGDHGQATLARYAERLRALGQA